MITTNFYNKNGLKIDLFFQEDNFSRSPILITFTERGNTELEGHGFGGDFIIENKFNLIAIKSSRKSWFKEVEMTQGEEIDSYIKKLDLRII